MSEHPQNRQPPSPAAIPQHSQHYLTPGQSQGTGMTQSKIIEHTGGLVRAGAQKLSPNDKYLFKKQTNRIQ